MRVSHRHANAGHTQHADIGLGIADRKHIARRNAPAAAEESQRRLLATSVLAFFRECFES